MKTIKTHLLAFALGMLVACAAVFYLTSGDKGVKQLAESKKAIKEEVTILQKENAEIKKNFTVAIKKAKEAAAEEVNKAATPIAKLQAENKGLKKQVQVLKLHINTQGALIAKHQKLHAESLEALNKASRTMAAKTARQKAFNIGVGVGVPLMLIGGFVGGFYLAGVVK